MPPRLPTTDAAEVSSSARSATAPTAASSHPADARTTGFGTTMFDSLAPAVSRALQPASVFDVCHVGVMLRALVFVHGVVAIGAMFGATGFQPWLLVFMTAASAAFPGVLLWLLMACAGKRPFGALPLIGQWAVAIALGALSGAAGSVLPWMVVADAVGGPMWIAPALAGAAMAAAMFLWLRLRALATLPAEATARLAELQSRIRPHFLFNTLNTALVLVRLDPARAEGVLEDLAELFRVAISDTAESVTLAEEVELARRYLAIEQIRFGNRMQVTWELDPEAGLALVPPLLLQPLVENAVRHGIEPTDAPGIIRVRTRVKLGRALVSIVNTVPGAASQPGNGIALRNVRDRLRLMHDVAAQFEARREEEVFRVQIVLPL
jgi:two-component system, LytTR family, sensor histidine kinase AlgZ